MEKHILSVNREIPLSLNFSFMSRSFRLIWASVSYLDPGTREFDFFCRNGDYCKAFVQIHAHIITDFFLFNEEDYMKEKT